MITLTIRTAEEQRAINEAKHEALRQMENMAIENTIEKIFEACKAEIDKTLDNMATVRIYNKLLDKGLPTMTREECQKLIFAPIETILTDAGYHVDISVYSESWSRKSGKFATIYILF